MNTLLVLAALSAVAAGDTRSTNANAFNGWHQYGGNPQHTAISRVSLQPLQRIVWQTPIDKAPQYSGSNLLVHYTGPMISRSGTVVIPVKTAAGGSFVAEGRRHTDGALLWTTPTDWSAPPSGWGPVIGAALFPQPGNRNKTSMVIAASGGRVIIRDDVDSPASRTRVLTFFGDAAYRANPTAYNNNVKINTPITVDNSGNIYFGYQVLGSNPLGLVSGLAKITPTGSGLSSGAVYRYKSMAGLTGGLSDGKVTTNCAPAISLDGKSLYFSTNGATPYIVAVSAASLAPIAATRLTDPNTGNNAWVADEGTASPMVASDGTVWYGILENPAGSNHYRGWMLRFSMGLTQIGRPGAFGWDDTCSLVPKAAVPSYKGPSPYLVLTKYNNYYGIGGDGRNKLAILDPASTKTDPETGVTVLKEVLTVLGITPDGDGLNGKVREWCINTAAIDVAGKCALVNCEDGKAFRWDFVTNTLSEQVTLTAGIGEAYTSTVIGPDGKGYAINNATVYVLGSN